MGAGGIRASTYGYNPDGSRSTAQDVIAARNASYAAPYTPGAITNYMPARAAGKTGLGGNTVDGVTEEQLYNFYRNFYGANPQASPEEARVAGFNQGIFETPKSSGGWNTFLTQFLPAAIGYAISGGALNGILPGVGGAGTGAAAGSSVGSHTVGGLAAGGAGHATSGVIAPLVSGGGALSSALSAVPDIVVSGTRGAASSTLGGIAGAAGAGATAPLATTQPDIEVTGSRPTARPEINPGDIVVTANAANGGWETHTPAGMGAAEALAGGTHSTPTPKPMPNPTNFPWRQLLRMIPRGGDGGGGGRAPQGGASPTMANASSSSPFGGGGAGVGAGQDIQGANRPSIYPWVKPGVTSSGQAGPNPDENGDYV